MRFDWGQQVERLFPFVPVLAVVGLYIYHAAFQQAGSDGSGSSTDFPTEWALGFLVIWAALLTLWIGAGHDRIRAEQAELYTKLDARIDRISPAVVQTFHTVQEYYDFLAFRARHCRTAWYDMGGFDPQQRNIPAPVRQRYYTERNRLSTRIDRFRYLGNIRTMDHLERVESMVRQKPEGLSEIRFYGASMDDPSKVEVTIIDDSLLVMGYFQVTGNQLYVATSDRATIDLFARYYDDIWSMAGNLPLKSGASIFPDNLDAARRRLSGEDDGAAAPPEPAPAA